MKKHEVINDRNLKCARCNVLLEPGKVNIKYLKGGFPTTLLKCPKCNQVYISEELAMGKVVEVEKTLEEK
jgi:phage FluMu protein Com